MALCQTSLKYISNRTPKVNSGASCHPNLSNAASQFQIDYTLPGSSLVTFQGLYKRHEVLKKSQVMAFGVKSLGSTIEGVWE